MKVSLTVAVPGDMEGKKIPITLAEFVIGRDPQCHLCPGSPRVGSRHCALRVRANKVFLKNFDRHTGTYVNDRRIDGEVQLLNGDWLKIGPLLFCVNIEAAPSSTLHHEDLVAQLLLIEGENGEAKDGTPRAGGTPATETDADRDKPPEDKDAPAPVQSPAAKAILEKYRRRGRG
jgi:pSer/pThr/pTyr-binding forkhead associated (FHA) protein